ncbi:MAG: HNH endonuclease [Planctomycetota bacterium]
MDAATLRLVRNRAGNRCEYCRLHQDAAPFLRFHIEHIQARQHIQDDSSDNLALACPDCNRHKGPNLTTLDPNTREVVLLYHPRKDDWNEHFVLDGYYIRRTTQTGIATENLLKFNSDERVEMRSEIDPAN